MTTAGKIKILVIDDDPVFQKIMWAAISKFGFLPHTTADPDEFLELAKKHRPSLYIIDLNLGQGRSGLELIEAIRKIHGPKVPIFVLSGSDGRAQVCHALELGATDFIVKPFDRDFIASKLSRFVKSKELGEYLAEWTEVPHDDKEPNARLVLNCEVAEIDELGIRIRSKHLIPKGLELSLSGEWIRKLSGSPEVTATVVSTSLDPENLAYEAYAEFENTDSELLQKVRHWLSMRKSVA
jgi:DNA-binding response OmpR family regulator